MIKLKVEIANGEIISDCEINGSGGEVIAELATIIHNVIYKITNSKEEFAVVAMCLADLLNGADYETVKEAFSNELQRQSD